MSVKSKTLCFSKIIFQAYDIKYDSLVIPYSNTNCIYLASQNKEIKVDFTPFSLLEIYIKR